MEQANLPAKEVLGFPRSQGEGGYFAKFYTGGPAPYPLYTILTVPLSYTFN